MLLQCKGLSERRACRHLGLDRSSVRYEKRPEDPVNGLIREELQKLSVRHRRYGTPCMTAMLRRQGFAVNHKRVERIWAQEGLPLPRKRPKRRYPGPSERPNPATKPNDVWSFDFVHDRTVGGEKLKMLTVMDEYTRECLEIRVERRMDSRHVLETLDELMNERGVPRYTRSDNGPEFISSALVTWLREKGVQPVFIEPGSPWENGFVESLHGKLRDECLNAEIFWS